MSITASAPAASAAPSVEAGTALARDEARTAAWQEEVAASTIDAKVWTGAFATNVWGGRYEIDSLLGQGGQGTTFAGVDRKTGARVAVKVLDLSSVEDWKRVELFQREVNTLKRLEHSSIPTFLDVIEDESSGARALVMTQVAGENFAAAVKDKGPLGEAELWRVLVDVIDVLAFLHGQSSPVVHRDIKPSNLIARTDGGISVVDFGGVGHAKAGGGSTIVGTFGYMAPEQLYGDSTPATDLYALGATLLSLATGQEPENLPRDGLAIDIDKAVPQLSESMRSLLKRLLAPDPKARPATAGQVAMELNALYEQATSGQAPSGPGTFGPGSLGNDASPTSRREARAQRRTARKQAKAERKARRHQARHPDQYSDDSTKTDARTEARWAPETDAMQEDAQEAVQLVEGVVSLFLGVAGTILAVGLGEILIPLLLGVVAGFTDRATAAKLRRTQANVRASTQTFRKSLDKTTKRGAIALEQVSYRKQKRRIQRRDRAATPKPPPRHHAGRGRP